MKTYYTTGTIGDAYVIVCKLYAVAKQERVLCKHYSGFEGIQQAIKEIYSLIPNINVEFINERSSDINVWGTFEPRQLERERNRYGLKQPEYYPEFELGNLNHFNLPETYVTLQIKAGTHAPYSRSLSVDIINDILNSSKLPVVIIGEKTTDLPIENFNILDLRDKTTIKEVINIIKNSKHFYGLLGFLSFVAVSHKIISNLWIKSRQDINAVKIRQEAVKEWGIFYQKIGERKQ